MQLLEETCHGLPEGITLGKADCSGLDDKAFSTISFISFFLFPLNLAFAFTVLVGMNYLHYDCPYPTIHGKLDTDHGQLIGIIK